MLTTKKRCLVTGGAGFIGSHLVDELLLQGHTVTVIDNLSSGSSSNMTSFKNHPNLSFIKADIRNFDDILAHFKHIDWVFHLAGLADIVPSIENPKEYYDVNVTGTLNVCMASVEHNIQKCVYAASSSCYGLASQTPTPETAVIQPQYPYALTKYCGEQLINHWHLVYKLSTTSLRLFNVYGPRSRTAGTYGAVFGVFLAQKYHNKPFTVVGDGEQQRDFTYVSDVVRAFIMSAEKAIPGSIFNVGTSKPQTINSLVQLLGGDKIYIPKRPGEPDITQADISAIQTSIGWSPQIPFEEGVQSMLAHISYWKNAPLWDKDTIKKATQKWFENLS